MNSVNLTITDNSGLQAFTIVNPTSAEQDKLRELAAALNIQFHDKVISLGPKDIYFGPMSFEAFIEFLDKAGYGAEVKKVTQ